MNAHADFLEKIDTIDGIIAWLDAILDAALSNPESRGCPIGSMVGEISSEKTSEDGLRANASVENIDADVHEYLRSCFTGWRGFLRNGLIAMQSRGEIASHISPESIADFIVACKQGGMLLARAEGNSAPLKRVIEELKTYLRSLKSI